MERSNINFLYRCVFSLPLLKKKITLTQTHMHTYTFTSYQQVFAKIGLINRREEIPERTKRVAARAGLKGGQKSSVSAGNSPPAQRPKLHPKVRQTFKCQIKQVKREKINHFCNVNTAENNHSRAKVRERTDKRANERNRNKMRDNSSRETLTNVKEIHLHIHTKQHRPTSARANRNHPLTHAFKQTNKHVHARIKTTMTDSRRCIF